MDEINDDDPFFDAADQIVLEALATIGDDPRARFAFFKRLLAVTRDVAGLPPVTDTSINPARTS